MGKYVKEPTIRAFLKEQNIAISKTAFNKLDTLVEEILLKGAERTKLHEKKVVKTKHLWNDDNGDFRTEVKKTEYLSFK